MINFRSESGKHIVICNGKEYKFNTLRIALIFIKYMEEDSNV